jgi:uncharacterized protein (TIGR02145 family)
MTKKISLIIAFFSTISCNGQPSKPNDSYANIRGNVKSVSERTFAVPSSEVFNGYKRAITDENLLKNVHEKWYFEEVHLGNEDLPYQSSFFFRMFWPNKDMTFDKNGHITSLKHSDGEVKYRYDTIGRIVEETRIFISKYVTPIYDNDGNMIGATEEPSDISENKVKCQYNQLNQIISRSDEYGNIIWTYTYNDRGQLVEENCQNGRVVFTYNYNANDHISDVIVVEDKDMYVFKYNLNDSGDITHITSSSKEYYQIMDDVIAGNTEYREKEGIQDAKYKYKYDDFGNWIERYETITNYGFYQQKGITRYVTVRNIEYFTDFESYGSRVIIPKVSIEWATCNVGEKGQFVSLPEQYGNLYTWEEAKNACPDGWRIPTKKELEELVEGAYITNNGVNGREFNNGNDKIFLPAYGFISPGNTSIYFHNQDGYYWSSDIDTESVYSPYVFLVFRKNMCSVTSDGGESRMSVRCVKE